MNSFQLKFVNIAPSDIRNKRKVLEKVLKVIQCKLHSWVKEIHKDLITSLQLHADQTLDLGDVTNSLDQATGVRDKVKKLFDAIISQLKLREQIENIIEYINFLLNHNDISGLIFDPIKKCDNVEIVSASQELNQTPFQVSPRQCIDVDALQTRSRNNSETVRTSLTSTNNHPTIEVDEADTADPNNNGEQRHLNTGGSGDCSANCESVPGDSNSDPDTWWIIAAMLVFIGFCILLVLAAGNPSYIVTTHEETVRAINKSTLPNPYFTNPPNSTELISTPTVEDKSPSTTVQIETTTVQEATPTTLAPSVKQRKRIKWRVKAHSYSDYKQLMSFPPANREIQVDINAQDQLSWPAKINLTNGDKIRRLQLGGHFLVTRLINVLNQTSNVAHLTLVNKKDILCSSNDGHGASLAESIHVQILLQQLITFVFTNFTTCYPIFMAMAEKVETPRLEGIALRSSQIDTKNINLIQGLFRKNWKTLTHIQLKDTANTANFPFFGSNIGVLTKVTSIFLDYPSNYIGPRLCRVLPNLQSINSSKGQLPESELVHLYACENLERLTISLKVSEFASFFDISTLAEPFQKMKAIEVTLLQDKCDNPEGAKILLEGLNTLKDGVLDFTVLSNCQIYKGAFNNFRRNERRFKRGNLNGFKYSIDQEFR